MAVAGYCEACQQYVYLNDQWGCVNGHAWNQVRNWYDPDTGTAVTPYWLQPGYAPAAPAPVAAPTPAPAPVAAPTPAAAPAPAPVAQAPAQPQTDRSALLAAILEALATNPAYTAQYGTDTDIVIGNVVADASWAGGKKKIEYSAILKAVEAERVVYFWEVLKESGGGLSFGTVSSESYTTFGTTRSGSTKQKVVGPGGVEVDAQWDYGATRGLVEAIAQARGWRVKTVLRKSSATW